MANTLKGSLILLQLVTLACCITTSDKKEELKHKNADAEDISDDLDYQETGWIFNPLQEKARTLEYLKDKVLYPFSALKSPQTGFGGGYPVYPSSSSNSYYPGYAGSYPTYSFSGNSGYYTSPKPKQFQYYNPIYSSYKKYYPSYPYKTWYNQNHFSTGGYQVNTASYAPDNSYPSSGQSFQLSTTSAPTYSSGTPLYYYYSSVTPSQTYGVPGLNIGAKTSIGVPSTSGPISYSSQTGNSFSSQTPPVSNVWRVSSSPQYSDVSSVTSNESPSYPSIPSLPSSAPPLFPSSISSLPPIPAFSTGSTTPSPPLPSTTSTPSILSTISPPTLASFSNSVPSSPSSVPIPIAYSHSYEGSPNEVIITPPPPVSRTHYENNLPGPKIALQEPSYIYNPPPSYAVAYYPNVFYITNEQRLEKTSSTQTVGTQDATSGGTADDSTVTSTPTVDSQGTTSDVSTPASKAQSSVQTLPGPGLTTFYTSQTLDQTRIPVSYNSGQYVPPQTPGVFYSSPAAPNVYAVPLSAGGNGGYVSLSQGGPLQVVPYTQSSSSLSYSSPLVYTYGQSPVGYERARTYKNC